jgi:hypothetical protein
MLWFSQLNLFQGYVHCSLILKTTSGRKLATNNILNDCMYMYIYEHIHIICTYINKINKNSQIQ